MDLREVVVVVVGGWWWWWWGGGGPGCIRHQNMDSRKFRKAITFNEHVVNFEKAYCRP